MPLLFPPLQCPLPPSSLHVCILLNLQNLADILLWNLPLSLILRVIHWYLGHATLSIWCKNYLCIPLKVFLMIKIPCRFYQGSPNWIISVSLPLLGKLHDALIRQNSNLMTSSIRKINFVCCSKKQWGTIWTMDNEVSLSKWLGVIKFDVHLQVIILCLRLCLEQSKISIKYEWSK